MKEIKQFVLFFCETTTLFLFCLRNSAQTCFVWNACFSEANIKYEYIEDVVGVCLVCVVKLRFL